MFPLNHSLEGCSSATDFALMGALRVVMMHPLVEISLQLLDGFIKVLSECDLIKLLKNGFVEPFANAVGLWMLDLGLGVINIVDGQEQLIIMFIGSTAIFRAAICHDA